MADVTINALTSTVPTTASIIPLYKDGSTLSTTLAQLGVLPFVPKAWVNFDGTGIVLTNQTIRSAYNVNSVFKNAIGDYTIYFTPGTFADTNYCIICSTSTPNQNLGLNISDNNGSGHAKEIFQSQGVAQRSSSSCRVGNYVYNDTYKYNPQAFGVVVYR